MTSLPVLVFVSVLLTGAGCVYVYKGNPFESDGGPFKINTRTLTRDEDKIPAHTEVFHPTASGTYVPIIFLPGVFTLVYAEAYATVLSNFASYGYIVAGINLFWPVEPARETIGPDTVFEVIQWLSANLDTHIPADIKADWSALGIMSHSVAAEYVVDMLLQNTTFAMAAAFLEPGSNHFTKPLGYSIPALSYGTQFCMERPRCCFEGLSYWHFYKELTCPKIMMNVTGYGHCDILDEIQWDICEVTHFCKVDKTNNRDLYREQFVPGVLAAFFGGYIQGNPSLLEYITTADRMPVPVSQLYSDLNCTRQ